MNAEKLLDIISFIDDEFIEEANTDKLKHKRKWLGWVSTVAAACLIFVMAALFIPKLFKGPAFSQNPDDFDFSNLPMLTVDTVFGEMGFEGYMAFDISELKNGNPWSENDNIIALPVFKNPILRDGAGRVLNGLSTEEMLQKAKETAEIMGWTIDKLYTNPTEEQLQRQRDKIASIPEHIESKPEIDEKPYEAVAKCGDFSVIAYPDGHVRIDFGDMYLSENAGITLPEKYSFTNYDTTEKQATEVIQYLLKEYKSFVNMKSPALDLFGHYNIYAQRMFSYGVYESDGDLIDKILGYNFNNVWFHPNENGKLWLIDRMNTDLSQKIGDYPIITTKEARELLLQNRYITTVPPEWTPHAGDFIDGNYIAKVELVYRSGREEIFMPYYKFYIELTGFTILDELNLKNFGVFYVPAVKQEYLTNMPLWDGRFN